MRRPWSVWRGSVGPTGGILYLLTEELAYQMAGCHPGVAAGSVCQALVVRREVEGGWIEVSGSWITVMTARLLTGQPDSWQASLSIRLSTFLIFLQWISLLLFLGKNKPYVWFSAIQMFRPTFTIRLSLTSFRWSWCSPLQVVLPWTQTWYQHSLQRTRRLTTGRPYPSSITTGMFMSTDLGYS